MSAIPVEAVELRLDLGGPRGAELPVAVHRPRQVLASGITVARRGGELSEPVVRPRLLEFAPGLPAGGQRFGESSRGELAIVGALISLA